MISSAKLPTMLAVLLGDIERVVRIVGKARQQMRARVVERQHATVVEIRLRVESQHCRKVVLRRWPRPGS